MHELALFAGAGGGILGGKLLGWRTICAVENDPHALSVLVARQNDGHLAPFPIWDDVRTFDGVPWRGRIDVISGGFPCQDISSLGKRTGLAGEKSGLWFEMLRIIREVRPPFVFLENSQHLVSRGLERILADLAALGYDARWGVLGADNAGAPHIRKRLWLRAEIPDSNMCRYLHSSQPGITEKKKGSRIYPEFRRPSWWEAEPDMGRVADGLPYQLDRIRRLGNAQVPAVVKLAWNELGKLKC